MRGRHRDHHRVHPRLGGMFGPPPPPPPYHSHGLVYGWFGGPPPPPRMHHPGSGPVLAAAVIGSSAHAAVTSIQFHDSTCSNDTPLAMATPIATEELTSQTFELFVEELVQGTEIARYFAVIPSDAKPDQIIQLNLGGRDYTVRLPASIRPGQRIVIVAPKS